MSEQQLFDAFGVPEFFCTTTRIENAGGGCIRIYNCIMRGRILVPVCSVIFPTASLLKIVQATHDFTRQITTIEMKDGPAH